MCMGQGSLFDRYLDTTRISPASVLATVLDLASRKRPRRPLPPPCASSSSSLSIPLCRNPLATIRHQEERSSSVRIDAAIRPPTATSIYYALFLLTPLLSLDAGRYVDDKRCESGEGPRVYKGLTGEHGLDTHNACMGMLGPTCKNTNSRVGIHGEIFSFSFLAALTENFDSIE